MDTLEGVRAIKTRIEEAKALVRQLEGELAYEQEMTLIEYEREHVLEQRRSPAGKIWYLVEAVPESFEKEVKAGCTRDSYLTDFEGLRVYRRPPLQAWMGVRAYYLDTIEDAMRIMDDEIMREKKYREQEEEEEEDFDEIKRHMGWI